MAEAPGEPEPGARRAAPAPCRPRRASSPPRGGRGRSRAAARAGRATSATTQSVAPSEKRRDPVVESEHEAPSLARSLSHGLSDSVRHSRSADGHGDTEREDDDGAERAGSARTTRPSKLDAVEQRAARRRPAGRSPVIDGGEADAERDDQHEAVADAVQRDRREQDDERGRAREEAARDPDGEQAAEAAAGSAARGWWSWSCSWP